MNDLNIEGIKIGINEKPYFIADIAANHDGDINKAYSFFWSDSSWSERPRSCWV